MAKDENKPLDAVVIPTLFLGELKYSADEIACLIYFESTNPISEYLRQEEIPKAIKIGIPSHIDLKIVKLVVERFFIRAFDKGASIFAQVNLITNEGVTKIWETMASTYWNNTSGTPTHRAKESYKRAAESTKMIAKKDKKNASLFKELETFLALCVSITDKTPALNPRVIKELLPKN